MISREQTTAILDEMKRVFPDADTTLTKTDPFHFLLSVILSAQATDVSVNKVTPALFSAYRTPAELASAEPPEVEKYIRTIGLYRNKARYLVGCSRDLTERFDGQVPQTREELMSLTGVGRKTANVVMAECFGIPALAVDTHVSRVAVRIGLADPGDVSSIERQLMQQIDRDRWIEAHHLLIFWGRYQCLARRPKCETCPLQAECGYFRQNR